MPDYSMVALYGIPAVPGSQLKQSYERCLEWFEELGFQPQKLGVSAPGFSGRYRDFKRENKKLQEFDFSKVESLEFLTAEISDEGPVPWRYELFAAISLRFGYCCLLAKTAYDSLFQSSGLKLLASELTELLLPTYGFGCVMGSKSGPSAYAIGLISGPFDEEEGMSISWWTTVMKRRQFPFPRDVYRWNFLNQDQLNAQVEGVPLREWIGRDSNRGMLESWKSGLQWWSLPDEQIPRVKPVLREAGVLFDWRKFVAQLEEEDRQRVEAPPPNPPAPDPATLDIRERLLEHIFDQHKQRQTPGERPVVSLEKFFTGCPDPNGCLGPSVPKDFKPPADQVLPVLQSLRARPDVQDLLVTIHDEVPAPLKVLIEAMPDYPEDAQHEWEADWDCWPITDALYLLTSLSREEVEELADSHGATGVRDGWQPCKPLEAPDPLPGYSVYRLIYE